MASREKGLVWTPAGPEAAGSGHVPTDQRGWGHKGLGGAVKGFRQALMMMLDAQPVCCLTLSSKWRSFGKENSGWQPLGVLCRSDYVHPLLYSLCPTCSLLPKDHVIRWLPAVTGCFPACHAAQWLTDHCSLPPGCQVASSLLLQKETFC